MFLLPQPPMLFITNPTLSSTKIPVTLGTAKNLSNHKHTTKIPVTLSTVKNLSSHRHTTKISVTLRT